MSCRAPATTATCTGASPNGAVMAYDNEATLSSWQDPQSGTSDGFLPDYVARHIIHDQDLGYPSKEAEHAYVR